MKNKFKKFGKPIFFALEQYYLGIIKIFLLAMIIIVGIKFFVMDFGVVEGRSMYPNFHPSEVFVVNKSIYLFHAPARYDVVQAIFPEEKKLVIKRIIGLPGETIIIRDGQVFIKAGDQEAKLAEPYLAASVRTYGQKQKDVIEFQIPVDHYLILGDNRTNSHDSRDYGAVPLGQIVGQIFMGW